MTEILNQVVEQVTNELPDVMITKHQPTRFGIEIMFSRKLENYMRATSLLAKSLETKDPDRIKGFVKEIIDKLSR